MENTPVWSPDGRRLVLSAGSTEPPALHVLSLDGDGRGERLAPSSTGPQFATDWVRTRAGEFILYWEASETDGLDVMLLPLADRRPRPWMRTRFNEWDARASPDGRWVAYVSDESGQLEVYVRPFEGPGEQRPVSSGGGAGPRWRRDGGELFYVSGDQGAQRLMSATVRPGRTLEIAAPTPLFSLRANWTNVEPFDEGRRFFVTDEGEKASMMVVLDWPSLLAGKP